MVKFASYPRQCNEDEGFSIRRSAYPRHDAKLEGKDNECHPQPHRNVLRKNFLRLHQWVNLDFGLGTKLIYKQP
jgi:hypothetical protein